MLLDFEGVLCINVVWNLGQFTYSKSEVASLLQFAHFGMRIFGGAQLLSSFQLMDCISIPLNFEVNTIGHRSLRGYNKAFLTHAFLQLLSYSKPKGYSCPFPPPLKLAHLPCFKILLINPILTTKLVHENSTTNIE
jgi:hypothetical protein